MKPYSGLGIIKQLPHLKENYRGKNMNGGRKCLFTQSREYRRRCPYGHNWESGVSKRASAWCSDPNLPHFTPTASKEKDALELLNEAGWGLIVSKGNGT